MLPIVYIDDSARELVDSLNQKIEKHRDGADSNDDLTLTTERIKDVIAHSSRQPDSGLTYPNNQYGYGEIDAYKGLLYLLNLTAIEELSDHQPQGCPLLYLSSREIKTNGFVLYFPRLFVPLHA